MHGQVEHLVEAGTAGTAGVTTGVTTGVTGGGTGGGTGGTGGAGGIGGSAGSVLPYALLVMNGNGVSRPLPANNTPVRLHKNEFLVCQWLDLSHYNHLYDELHVDDSVKEALGQRGTEEKRNDTHLTLEHCLGEYGNVETL